MNGKGQLCDKYRAWLLLVTNVLAFSSADKRPALVCVDPAGISSMFFYHASIIIHDIFRTNRTDPNKSDTSSYLDLAPLYGSSLKDQLEIRTMQGGKLKADTFHEKRLLGQRAGGQCHAGPL